MRLQPYIRTILLACIAMTLHVTSYSQQFEFTDNCLNAYQSFMAMKVETGKAYLQTEMAQNKSNYLPIVLMNYEDFITLTFNENPSEFKRRKYLLESRLKALQSSYKNSPFYLFSKGLLHLQWSIIQTKYGEYWDAAWDFRKSHVLFAENQKKYPDFKYNQIFLGTQEAVISTIPSGYKWISNILGLKGNMKVGMSRLSNYFNVKDDAFKEEAYLYFIYLTNYLEHDAAGAAELIKTGHLDTKNNMLYVFMAANLALNNKKAAVAEAVISNRNKGKDYIAFPMLDYELADAKMKRLDFTAISYFEKYITTSQSNFYIKDACLNIALCYYLQNNQTKANEYLAKTKRIGKSESDADKQALKFTNKGVFPDKDLLKARLLNDGGNNEQALQILTKKDIKTIDNESEKIEYYYRIARIYDDLEKTEKAIEFYNYSIKIGRQSSEYFAARASLQAGYLFEKKGNKKEALRYYNQVLDMDDHDYKNSLDQRAKAAINNLTGG